MATETTLNTLTINYLTQAQFDALATKEANEIYLTPDSSITTVTAGSGLSGGGSSGSVTLNHSNSVTAKSTQAFYPITFDAQGHITGAGTAITPITSHNTAYLYAGASNGTANAATTNGNTYLILMDGGSATTRRKISGTQNVSVTSDSSGNITITGPNLSSYITSSDIPTKTSQLTNDSGYITSYVNTATAADNILDGSNSGTEITYAPYTSRQTGLSFYTGTTAPNGTTRLNLNGYLYATKLYSNGSEVLTSYTETDPTVPSWAKASSKPTYTASEVGALPSTTTIPTKTSQLTNDSGFITSDSDENVKNTTITTASTIYLTGSTSSSTATSGLSKHASVNLYLTADSGTDGNSRLTLGNSTATGTAGAKYGLLRLYGNTAYYVDIRTESSLPTGNRTIYLPSYAGSMYLTCTSTTNAVGGATTAPVYVDDTGRIQVVTSIPYSLLTGTPTIPDVSGKIDTAGSGLSKSGTTLNHASTITAGTVGTSSATSGVTLAVPYVTYNGTGHITATGTHTHTVPTVSTTAAGVMSKEDKIYLNSLVNAISASSTILYLQTDSSTTDSSLLTAIDDLGWTSGVVS